MKILKLTSHVAFLFAALALTSCAQMEQDFIDHNCNYNSAYEKGFNDSEAGDQMDSQMYSNRCPEESKQQALKGYREGYEKSLKAHNTGSQTPSIQIGGTQINLPGKVNNKAFFCKISVYEEKFDAFGATKLEASENVKKQCRAKYPDMNCDILNCVRNR